MNTKHLSISHAPVSSASLNTKNFLSRWKFAPTKANILLLLLLFIGATLLIQATLWNNKWEQNRQHQNFQEWSQTHINTLEESLRSHLKSAEYLASLFQASNFVTQTKFSQFASKLQQENENLIALEWVPVIKSKDLSQFLVNRRKESPDFQIFTKNIYNKNVPIDKRDFYYPISYIHPLDKNKLSIGYAPYQQESRMSTLYFARDNNQIAISDGFKVIQALEKGQSILAFYPVYKAHSSVKDIASRQKNIFGFTAIIFSVKDVILNAFAKSEQEFNIEVSDLNTSASEKLLYTNVSHYEQTLKKQSEHEKVAFFEETRLIDVANRTWKITLSAKQTDFSSSFNPVSWIILGMAIFTLFIFTYIYFIYKLNKSAITELNNEAKKLSETNRVLASNQERHRLAVSITNNGLIDFNFSTQEIYLSPRLKTILGFDENYQIDNFQQWLNFSHPDDKEEYQLEIEQLKSSNSCYQKHRRVKHNKGHYIWVLERGKFTLNKNNKPLRLVLTLTDISYQKNIEKDLRKEKELLQTTLDSINEGVIITNIRTQTHYINPVAEQITGWKLSDAQNKQLTELLNIIDEEAHLECQSIFQECIETQQCIKNTGPVFLINAKGKQLAIEQSFSPIHNAEEEIIGCVVVIRDVTQSQALVQELSHQSTHDRLTGLVNRSEFEQRVSKVIEQCIFEDEIHVLCYMDLDQFKVINDTCGHIAGDELLKKVSQLLKSLLRSSDVLARIGGDEFGFLFMHCPTDRAIVLTEKILQAIRDFQFVWHGKPYSIGASIGMVQVNSGTQSLTKALIEADAACYTAKEKGRNRIHIYHKNDNDTSFHHKQMHWVSTINSALQDDQFILCIQPIEPINNTDEKHFEVLLKMLSSDGETIPPGAFIPAAERYNLMSNIDRWVVHNLCKKLAYEETIDAINTCWAINLSAHSFNEPGFLQYVIEQMENFGINPNNLIFEVTETAAIANLNTAIEFIKALKNRGCRFSLDDFGSGMSSFGYLKSLPVDFLKIDGNFIKDIVENPIDHAMVKAINEIGQVMNMKTVAEFVETEEILKQVKAIGIDYAQGYHLGKPKPLA